MGRPWAGWMPLGVLVAGVLLRFAYLDADPNYYAWVGYITDEGRWVKHARDFALHGVLLQRHEGLHFFLAPLFQLATWLVFSVAGVSILTARLFPALCGSALLVVFWWALRERVTPLALLVGTGLLAFQVDHLALSRVAVPEIAAMLVELIVGVLLVSGMGSPARMVTAGLVLLVGLGMKLTTTLFVVIFSCVILLLPRDTPGARERWRDLACFWAGIAGPLVVVVALLFATGVLDGPTLRMHWNVLRGFVGLAGAYGVASVPFESLVAGTANVWALGAWLALLVRLAASPWTAGDRLLDRYLIASVVWVALYFLAMGLLEYFPDRYSVHVLTPLAVVVAVGVSMTERRGLWGLGRSISTGEPARAWLTRLVLVLPTLLFLVPIFASAMALAGLGAARLRMKILLVVVVLAVASYGAWRWRPGPRAAGILLVFPLVAGAGFLILNPVGGGALSFWPQQNAQAHLAAWLGFLSSALAVTALLRAVGERWGPTATGRLAWACAAGFLLLYLSKSSGGYLEPQYTLKRASNDLGQLVPPAARIVTSKAEGLFNGNRLRYESFHSGRWTSELPEILVVAFKFDGPNVNAVLAREYHILKTYELYVSPEYRRLYGSEAQSPIVRVYRRRSPAGAEKRRLPRRPRVAGVVSIRHRQRTLPAGS